MNDSAQFTRQRPLPAVTAGRHRLAEGGLVERGTDLAFTFDGRQYFGHPGDTLASALVANGVRLVGRSFKYHRPRGILTAGPEEPNALVELRTGARREPNTRATTAELYDGLAARSQNRWPSLGQDVLAINGLLAPMLAAGFYYKTFMWPASFWEKVYEPLIRRAAGLGRASGLADPDTYEKAHLHCDVLIVGGGPAGLMAALAAARAGARVVLADEDFRLGGRLLGETLPVGDATGAAWVEGVEAELGAHPDVRILRRTTVLAAYDHGTFAAVERVADHLPEPRPFEPRQRLWRIVAKQCVLAAGAIERPLLFPGNDRPGVMLAGAARTYANRYAALPGRRVVVVATTDDAARTVINLAHCGADVAAVVDRRATASQPLAEAAKVASAHYFAGGDVVRVHGRLGVTAVDVRTGASGEQRLGCDLVAMSGGWSPSAHLACHRGGRMRWDERLAAFLPQAMPRGMTAAGAAAGAFALAEALAEGARAGVMAAEATGYRAFPPAVPECAPEATAQAGPSLPPPYSRRAGKVFVDFQNDVTSDDVALAHREGYRAPEHMKRYTTLGMATDQGKTANVNALGVLAGLEARGLAEAGTTTFRPPFAPVSIGVLAGHHRGHAFRPTRLTPTHRWALAAGAVMVESGPWLRAQWYPRAGESDWLESVNREVRTVRSGVGVCDVSTLGKIDVQGADAARFLDFVYANTISTLSVGRIRYGLMLREDGFVLDDGTVARLGPDHFVVTTTTVNAGKVLQHMEHVQQWLRPDLDVALVSVTDQWAQLALCGPFAREVLKRVVDPGHDVSAEGVAHLAFARVSVMGGIEARLFRVSYSGELGYEIAVPAGYGDPLVRRIMDAGSGFGIVPYGTEALGVMRIEKGHVAGNEINGQTTAADLGLGRLVSGKKDCIGRVMAERPALVAPDRPQVVGLKPLNPAARLRAGAHLVPADREPSPASDQGYVTSVAFSPVLGQWIGLGLLQGGAGRHGARVRAADPLRSGDVLCEVVPPVFYDRKGERQHG